MKERREKERPSCMDDATKFYKYLYSETVARGVYVAWMEASYIHT